jgi:hypothetical protein
MVTSQAKLSRRMTEITSKARGISSCWILFLSSHIESETVRGKINIARS